MNPRQQRLFRQIWADEVYGRDCVRVSGSVRLATAQSMAEAGWLLWVWSYGGERGFRTTVTGLSAFRTAVSTITGPQWSCGHPRTPENTSKIGTGRVACRECHRRHARESFRRHSRKPKHV